MAKTRYAQAQAMANTGFLGMVEASVMKVGWDVLQDTEHPDFVQRAGLARLVLGGSSSKALIDGYIRRFGWFVVNVPAVQNQAYATGAFKPEEITDEAIDAAVETFWDTAAGVMPFKPEPDPEPVAIQTQVFEGPFKVEGTDAAK